jgi:hypothetical protein
MTEMDSFDCENLMDRGNAGVIILPRDEGLQELFIDSLSLAMVKYRRSMVFVAGLDEVFSASVHSACESYSLPFANRVAAFDMSEDAVEDLMDRAISAFSPGSPV